MPGREVRIGTDARGGVDPTSCLSDSHSQRRRSDPAIRGVRDGSTLVVWEQVRRLQADWHRRAAGVWLHGIGTLGGERDRSNSAAFAIPPELYYLSCAEERDTHGSKPLAWVRHISTRSRQGNRENDPLEARTERLQEVARM